MIVNRLSSSARVVIQMTIHPRRNCSGIFRELWKLLFTRYKSYLVYRHRCHPHAIPRAVRSRTSSLYVVTQNRRWQIHWIIE